MENKTLTLYNSDVDDYLASKGGGMTQAQVKQLITPMEHTIATMNANIKAMENGLSKSNHNVADNELQLYNTLETLKKSILGVRQDVNDMKTHFGNNASIIDNMENQIIALQKALKEHQATKHTGDPLVLYKWDLSLDGVGIKTLTELPWDTDYIYKYEKGGKIIEISKSNTDLLIEEELNKVAYTSLVTGLGVLMIERRA